MLCVWLAADAPARWHVRHLLEPICREGRLAGLATLAENRAWIEAAGLEIEQVEDWSRAVAPTWTIVARRVARGLVADGRYRRALVRGEGVFAPTVPRLMLAYRTGAMRYGFVVARKRGVWACRRVRMADVVLAWSRPSRRRLPRTSVGPT